MVTNRFLWALQKREWQLLRFASGVSVRVRRQPDSSSIFMTEAQAKLLALDKVAQSAGDMFVVLSNALSSQEAIKYRKVSYLLLLEVVSCADH
jgi:hypothetical protein